VIDFPSNIDGLTIPEGSVARAGGTDLQERLRSELNPPSIVDLTGIENFAGIRTDGTGTRIGAGTRINVVARDLADTYPALAVTSDGLATPQIRAHGTIGGNLAQHTRCWYYRHPELDCFKSGGDSCPLSVSDMLGDGIDPTRDNALPTGEVIAAINLPTAAAGERGAYFRSISRFEAEWPLVEAVVRATFDGDTVVDCGLGLGGVATVPRRMSEAESLITGTTLDDDTIAAAARACAEGANPLPETSYKVDLIIATVTETLERLRAQAGQQ